MTWKHARVTWSSGVESVTVAGESRDMLLLIGDGVDAGKLTRKLKKEVGEADILELRTLPATGSTSSALAPGSSTVVTQSAYQRHAATPGRSVPGGSRIECPFAAAAAAQWPGEHGRQQAVGYYHRRTPGPGYYHQQSSPMVGQGGYGYGYAGGSSFALEVARSHPANYSPMIARHDRPGNAGGRRELGGGGGPNCCSIL